MERFLMGFFRRAANRLLHRTLSKGIDHMTGDPQHEPTPEEKAQSRQARQMARRARQAQKAIRRINRF